MRPFSISEGAKTLVGAYPPADLVRSALHSLRYEERLGLLRLWVSEGIPFAFQHAPLLYESIRHWLGSRLSVHPKLITLVGSARIGYSLSPQPAFGKPLSADSDLDLLAVTETVFERLRHDFERWKDDISDGSVHPRNDREERFWQDNLEKLPKTIARGFVDCYKIPALPGYNTVGHVRQTEWLLRRRIEITPEAPVIKGASIRVYKDWQSFLNQLERNLHSTLMSFNAQHLAS